MRNEAGGSETRGPEPGERGGHEEEQPGRAAGAGRAGEAQGGGDPEEGSKPGEQAQPPAADHRKHRWRRWLLWAVLLIIVVIIAIWGVRKWIYGRHHESTDDAQVSGHLVPVLNRVSAYVAEVYVHDGDHVMADQLLVRLEETDLRPALAEAEAAVAEAEAAGGGVAGRQGQARAGGPPGQAGAQVQQARQQAAAAARLEGARAAVEQARLQLSYTRITAPRAGIVANRNVDPGQLVEPGQPLMVVVADSGVYITANFKETQVEKLRPGQLVEIDIDAYGDCDATGVVESLGGATGSEFALLPPNNATGNFVKVVQRIPVRILVTQGCGPERRLRPGMSVTVHVRTNE
jgi:membrane fusion protein (multidrug efflux system)